MFERVDLSKSRNGRDFGRGFYTTTIREQAGEWARALFTRYGGDGPELYVFEFDFAGSDDAGLRIKEFDGLNLEWLDMVRDNRIRGGLQHSFDIVRGPVANDNTMPTVALYVDGTLRADAALVQLAYFKANDQISFHTKRAIDCLRLVERCEL
jgi:hypothetical protein